MKAEFDLVQGKFDLAQGLLELAAQLAIINSSQSFTASKSSRRNNKEIDETSCEVFILALQFADLSQREILKIFQNRFCSLNLYKLWNLKGCNIIYQDPIAIKDSIVKI